MSYSLDELKRMIRRIEFNQTEPKLLVKLIEKAKELGHSERRRLRRLNVNAQKLALDLQDKNLILTTTVKEDDVNFLRKRIVGSIDGSFQVTGGISGVWYVPIGVSSIFYPEGIDGPVNVEIAGTIGKITTFNERRLRSQAELMMMLLETRAMKILKNKWSRNYDEIFLLIDGPIIDPPWCKIEEYVCDRVEAIKLKSETVTNIGFIKRIMGSIFLGYIKEQLEDKSILSEFVSDNDFISMILWHAFLSKNTENKSHIYFTKPLELPITLCFKDLKIDDKKIISTYKKYREKGIYVYFSYYRSNLTSKTYRVEISSTEEMDENELNKKFESLFKFIHVWTPPKMDIPLPIILAHSKCDVKLGAAETLYYEIIAKAYTSEDNLEIGIINLWT